MKKRMFVVFLIFCVLTAISFAEEIKGPYADKVYINVKMQEEIGLKDAAEGITDVFLWGVNAPTLYGMPETDLEKLEIYSVPSGAWSLNINPYPNEAPYQVEKEDDVVFNPFAIREIRFAINFLIDRKYIVDEILGGAGFPLYCMATVGQPGTTEYNKVAEEFGFSAEGNEEKAINDITTAMKKAAALPENNGRLVKGEKYWEFDGKPVAIQFVIRVDDPNGRVIEGNYISSQLEKAGFKVEKLMWDRAKSNKIVYAGNPADYEWNIYTEGWGAGATRRYWEHIVAQMYAPWYGFMAGGSIEGNWNYKNKKLDELTRNAYYGKFVTVEEYWKYALEGLRIGLEESLRIYVCAQEDFFTANKERFDQRFAYGLGDGVNNWMFVTGKTEDNILKVTQYSAQGSLFMKAWDPIGTDGFSDVYSTKISKTLIDPPSFESPVSGVQTPMRANWRDVVTEVERINDQIVGQLDVPAEAVKYNPDTEKWEPVGEGIKAMSKATYDFVFTNWHDGTPMSLNDLLYFEAFISKWATKQGDADKEYDETYSSMMRENAEMVKGWIIDYENEEITTYFDYNFPPSEARVASMGIPSFTVSAVSGTVCGVTWTIDEAIARMITDGSESGTQYSISPDGEYEIDILVPSHVADIKAKLQEMHDVGHIPVQLTETMTVEEAKKAYKNAIDFIDEMGHAYIGNGPFILSVYDPESNYMGLTANREWPWTADYWMDKLSVPRLNINDINVPTLVPAGKDFILEVDISKVVYPSITPEMAEEGDVTVFIGDLEGINGQITNTGEFKIKVPGSMTNELSGTQEILVRAELEGSVPVEKTKTIVFW